MQYKQTIVVLVIIRKRDVCSFTQAKYAQKSDK